VKGETAARAAAPPIFARSRRAAAGGRHHRLRGFACATELLFDQGVGDLFVIRVAGNVVKGAGPPSRAASSTAWPSLAYRSSWLLGHSECGAVKAAIKHMTIEIRCPGPWVCS